MTASLSEPGHLAGQVTKAGGEAKRGCPPQLQTDNPQGVGFGPCCPLSAGGFSPGPWHCWWNSECHQLTDNPASSHGAWPWADFRQPGASPPQTSCPQTIISQAFLSHGGSWSFLKVCFLGDPPTGAKRPGKPGKPLPPGCSLHRRLFLYPT